jgi:hypothetical protein
VAALDHFGFRVISSETVSFSLSLNLSEGEEDFAKATILKSDG